MSKIKDSESDQSYNIFLLSWDCNGLEACIDITKISQDYLFETIKGNDKFGDELGRTLHYLKMRAMANTQRHYEIYSVKVDEDIDKDTMVQMFEDDPQGMANLVRDRGNQIFSDRAGKPKIV